MRIPSSLPASRKSVPREFVALVLVSFAAVGPACGAREDVLLRPGVQPAEARVDVESGLVSVERDGLVVSAEGVLLPEPGGDRPLPTSWITVENHRSDRVVVTPADVRLIGSFGNQQAPMPISVDGSHDRELRYALVDPSIHTYVALHFGWATTRNAVSTSRSPSVRSSSPVDDHLGPWGQADDAHDRRMVRTVTVVRHDHPGVLSCVQSKEEVIEVTPDAEHREGRAGGSRRVREVPSHDRERGLDEFRSPRIQVGAQDDRPAPERVDERLGLTSPGGAEGVEDPAPSGAVLEVRRGHAKLPGAPVPLHAGHGRHERHAALALARQLHHADVSEGMGRQDRHAAILDGRVRGRSAVGLRRCVGHVQSERSCHFHDVGSTPGRGRVVKRLSVVARPRWQGVRTRAMGLLEENGERSRRPSTGERSCMDPADQSGNVATPGVHVPRDHENRVRRTHDPEGFEACGPALCTGASPAGGRTGLRRPRTP